jgi:hypothetical protein
MRIVQAVGDEEGHLHHTLCRRFVNTAAAVRLAYRVLSVAHVTWTVQEHPELHLRNAHFKGVYRIDRSVRFPSNFSCLPGG